jgi:hypothetical protein
MRTVMKLVRMSWSREVCATVGVNVGMGCSFLVRGVCGSKSLGTDPA